MKENINKIESMDMENFIGSPVIYIRELTRMMREMGTEKCISLMVQLTKVTGQKVFKTGKVL
jgi:hypothetical protein